MSGDKKISGEDADLWHRVAKTVKPYGPRPPAPDRPLPPKSKPRAEHKVLNDPAPLPPSKDMPSAPMSVDKRTRRGRIEIDRKIDLHGLTYEQALRRLQQQIHMMQSRGDRVLLVVTGKGRGGEGVLRRALPDWLARPELRPRIARYAPAHIRHGGGGAFYVFLKASKSM